MPNCNTPQLLPASAWKEKKCRHISEDCLYNCEGEYYSLLLKQPYLYLMTNSDGDNWEEDRIHISKAIWLPSSRDSSTVAPGNAAKCRKNPLKTASKLRGLIESEDWWSRSIYHATPLQFPRSRALFISVSPCHKCKKSWGVLLRQELQVCSTVCMSTNKHAWSSFWNGNLVHFKVLHN